MEFTVRAAREEEVAEIHEVLGIGFGFDPEPKAFDDFKKLNEFDRTRCAYEGSTMIGTCGAFSLDLTVPGASLPAAGTTLIAVRSSHRRRGVLRAMLRAHLEDVRERGEPLAALWASESSIYGRFGYGVASQFCGYRIETAHAEFREPVPAGQFRLLDPEHARKLLPAVYERVFRERPGHFARSEGWWEHWTSDPPWERRGGSKFRYALYEEAGKARGYLQYRILPGQGNSTNPALDMVQSRVWVKELQGVDPGARAALWRYALDLDLVRSLEAWSRPVDDGLVWLLRDARRLERLQSDGLWLRVMDVEQALAGRAYRQDGGIRIALHDPECPWNDGSFELSASPSGAACRRTTREPEIELGIEELSAVYLGGTSFGGLARAGRIQGSPAALWRADALFTWDPAPWCPEVF